MSNQVELYDRMTKENALGAVKEVGMTFAGSGLFGVVKPEQAEVMAMTCFMERLTPIEFSRRYHIIKGKLAMKADFMLARFLEIGGKVIWLKTGDDGKECSAKWIYGGNDIEIGFTYEEAVRAGLPNINENWKKYPGAMLRARCIAKAVRMLAPQVNAGVHTPEEIDDIGYDTTPPTPGKAPLLSPRKGRKAAPIIKDADATVIDDAPDAPPATAEPAPVDAPAMDFEDAMAANEVAVNAFLTGKTKWIQPGQTWRVLSDGHRETVVSRLPSFIEQATAYHNESEQQNEQ